MGDTVIFESMNSERGINRRGTEAQRPRRDFSAQPLCLCASAVKPPFPVIDENYDKVPRLKNSTASHITKSGGIIEFHMSASCELF